MANPRSYGLLVTLSVIWGLAFGAIRRADFELSAVNLTLLRWALVCVGFLVIYPAVIKPKVKFEWKDFPRLALVAVANVVVYQLALTTAEKQVDASLAGLLISFGPLTTVLLSTALLRERMGSRLWLALVLAVTGSTLIASPDLTWGSTSFIGPLLVIVAAVSNGVFTVASKRLTTKYGPLPVAAWSAFLGTAMISPLATPGLIAQAASLSSVGWLAVLYLAFLSTVLTSSIYFTLISRHQLTKLGIQMYLVPLVSALGGVLILGESIAPVTLAGGALLLTAVALATTGRR